ncbi:hypothetical protein CkaCkLH20_12127 [Colletotrichum karsti]|uniref:ubiquitinyl hydrolase 1 n=1 Tax=Colletotrichum karsti TaxID=1095194 RepID=A0A9P6I207_9PEZI|nr:uncharacterized protein CkaCkLH20_12127 [Colletotrichum karsti]KAF9870460.1 hypothetical protein CkaCkLH20_12127 [Colletotrichum karsti]
MAGRNFNQLFPPKPTFTEHELPDQTGRVYFVTGGVSGIGLELCKILYGANATIYIATRSASKIIAAIAQLKSLHPSSKGRLESLVLDLSDLTTIKPAVEVFLAKEPRLDVLVHNAGVMMPPQDRRSAQGHELQMGTNALGPFLLTRCLEERLRMTAGLEGVPKGSVRVVWVASMISLGAPKGGVVWDNEREASKELGDSMADYMQSKVGCVFLAEQFSKRPDNSQVISVSVNPGLVKTELQRHAPAAMSAVMGLVFKGPKYGAYNGGPDNEALLMQFAFQCLVKFNEHVGTELSFPVQKATGVIDAMLKIHKTSKMGVVVDEGELVRALRGLPESGSIAAYVKEQNAGVLITKTDFALHIESFELSPTNEAVTTTIGRLRRSFPGTAVTLSLDKAREPGFFDTLAATIAKMSTQPAPETRPRVKKAGNLQDENRDTTHPKMVTELLTAFLLAIGQPLEGTRIWKNTRDEVLWKNCYLPWRRSPLWILIRVVLHLVFFRSSQHSIAHRDIYKRFMAFLMGNILQHAIDVGLRSDIFFTMTAKLSRRMVKLGSEITDPALDDVRQRMCCANETLRRRWIDIQQKDSPDLSEELFRLKTLDFTGDTMTQLPELDSFIASLANRVKLSSVGQFCPSWVLQKYQSDDLPGFSAADNEHLFLNLLSFEGWVADHLSKWVQLQLENNCSAACGQLRGLIKAYHGAARSLYDGDPELTSVMLLTILELWIACDKIALKLHPLLEEYDPGVPLRLFQSLLLPPRRAMERLFCAELYLTDRSKACGPDTPTTNIYSAYGTTNCFSVRSFDLSAAHQQLLRKIEIEAQEAHDLKIQELDSKKMQYNQLKQKYENMECTYERRYDPQRQRHYSGHANKCKRCITQNKARQMDISIFEWPLPQKKLEKKSVVFELALPEAFGHWRAASAFFLLDVLGMEHASPRRPQSQYSLATNQDLRRFFDTRVDQTRIGLVSETKPNKVTHRKSIPISTATQSMVCLNNGLRYAYFDCDRSCFVDSFELQETVPKACTYELPRASSALQMFFFRPYWQPNGPSPNTVIATQCDCPDGMSVDEYKALASIPLGHRIQWQNILLQLFSPTIDFKKGEVGLFVLQCIYQAGPDNGTVLRSAHAVAEDANFAPKMLAGIEECTGHFEENWQSSTALATFISVVCRLLTLNKVPQISKQLLAYLCRARAVTFGWANQLREKARETFDDDDEKTKLQRRAMEVFLVCSDTFNTDQAFQQSIFADDDNATIFFQCSIAIQEHSQSLSASLEKPVQNLYSRWKRVALSCYGYLADRTVMHGSNALDRAIQASWAAYAPTGQWTVYSNEHDHWLCSLTESEQHIHYGLLTGELLVDGVPLDHLPGEYLSHLDYRRLFGRLSLEIMPTSVPGMKFSSKSAYAGHDVHLLLSIPDAASHTDLLVHATQDQRAFDLIPSHYLAGKLPTAFVENYIHWYNHDDDTIEFCDGLAPWSRGESNWKLRRHREQRPGFWVLSRNDSSLLNVNSKSAKLIGSILAPLENRFWIHATYRNSRPSILIDLHRPGLQFSLTPGDSLISSREYRGMSVDTSQAIGTLIGLKDKLVLKVDSLPDPALSADRKVLVLEGDVKYIGTSDHIEVTIKKDFGQKVHAYDVDDGLGKIASNGSYQSKLFLCYLHALTSFCIPDPLTGRTGSEEALGILDSAAMKSFETLPQNSVDMLCTIASLTPGRSYYPEHERVMQTVDWLPHLSFLSQHGLFYDRVRSILDVARTTRFFHPQLYIEPPKLDHVGNDLYERDHNRASTFRVSGFGAEAHTVLGDKDYTSRDRDQNHKSCRSFSMAHFVLSGRQNLSEPQVSSLSEHLWSFLADKIPRDKSSNKKTSSVRCQDCHKPAVENEIHYDADFLLASSDFITEQWITLHKDIIPAVNKFKLMIWLATLAFVDEADMDIIQTLASFRTATPLDEILPPVCQTGQGHFDLALGACVDRDVLSRSLRCHLKPFYLCPEASISQEPYESAFAFEDRTLSLHHSKADEAVRSLAACLISQWPCMVPDIPSDHRSSSQWNTYLKLENIGPAISDHFLGWYDNLQFKSYLEEISQGLPSFTTTLDMPTLKLSTNPWVYCRKATFINEDDIFSQPPPSVPIMGSPALCLGNIPRSNQQDCRLPALLQRLQDAAQGVYEQRYVDDLRASLHAMHSGDSIGHGRNTTVITRERLVKNYQQLRKEVKLRHETMRHAILGLVAEENDLPSRLFNYYQRPRISTASFLTRLGKDNRRSTHTEWTKCITAYGVSMTQLQRAQRMLACWDDTAALFNELQNPGHTNWDPLDYPDTLLLEIESGIMVREVQEEIASRMRDPPMGRNAVMQLNMGEGKSSVIVPMTASYLADGTRIVRGIVAKPQSKQMLQMLVSKFGGLLNRRVFHLPFTRSVKVGPEEAEIINSICRECMESGGVLLVQPAHILSLRLMAIECAIAGKMDVSRSLLKTKDFLDKYSRDIVDESDENFSVKFELVYTMGTQRSIEHSPDRWVCVHDVLDVLRKLLPAIQRDDTTGIEVSSQCRGGFPRLRILKESTKNMLLNNVARHLSQAGSTGLPMATQSSSVQKAVFSYISKSNLSQLEIDAVERSGLWASPTKETLLLLRGLLGLGVLSFVFCQKRWRVDYGLDVNRHPKTRLAVPYRAKDSPAARSEFSHPEVIIALTSLSYYYGGLTDEELFLSFRHIVRSDQADMEYRVWVMDSDDLPLAFHQLSGVNLEDGAQCVKKVFPSLRYAKGVVDYFLAHIVFPKELKEFPFKLSASGWDIGEEKSKTTTGFSGTNDSKAFLPLAVSQLEDPSQQHTNALVLEYLLRDENSVALMPKRTSTVQSDAEALLQLVTNLHPPVRVILDVGAQILELDNIGVAQRWLEITRHDERTQAVVFCDEDDQICVVDRQGRVETFHTSPFASQSDVCLVFLDEAHTRGTDLKLPGNYRAAVTLGASLTKDRLVQACMRMRKLGKGQSVVFCVPDEIQQKIFSQSTIRTGSQISAISVLDILEWAISETMVDLRRGICLWANQGRRFEHHKMLWSGASAGVSTNLTREHALKFLEEEAQTLNKRYRPTVQRVGGSLCPPERMNVDVDAITARVLEFGDMKPGTATFREEQERELSPEVEQEREIQRPPPAKPAAHALHTDIQTFVSYGMLVKNSPAYMPAFMALSETTAAQDFDVTQFRERLLVTADFVRTVERSEQGYVSDLFQRSVQWILTKVSGAGVVEIAIMISPYEAQELLPDITQSKMVSLHLYAPRPNLGYRPLDALDLYTVPHQQVPRSLSLPLTTELNLFSGQLYFKSLDEYGEVRRFLGLIPAEDVVSSELSSGASPVAVAGMGDTEVIHFVRVLMTKIRRNCESIDKTHIGRVLDHRLLSAEDFV